jgi:hypothetical protein
MNKKAAQLSGLVGGRNGLVLTAADVFAAQGQARTIDFEANDVDMTAGKTIQTNPSLRLFGRPTTR